MFCQRTRNESKIREECDTSKQNDRIVGTKEQPKIEWISDTFKGNAGISTFGCWWFDFVCLVCLFVLLCQTTRSRNQNLIEQATVPLKMSKISRAHKFLLPKKFYFQLLVCKFVTGNAMRNKFMKYSVRSNAVWLQPLCASTEQLKMTNIFFS